MVAKILRKIFSLWAELILPSNLWQALKNNLNKIKQRSEILQNLATWIVAL